VLTIRDKKSVGQWVISINKRSQYDLSATVAYEHTKVQRFFDTTIKLTKNYLSYIVRDVPEGREMRHIPIEVVELRWVPARCVTESLHQVTMYWFPTTHTVSLVGFVTGGLTTTRVPTAVTAGEAVAVINRKHSKQSTEDNIKLDYSIVERLAQLDLFTVLPRQDRRLCASSGQRCF
jgi:hypothetical protein